jgi:hypothetical protein
METKNDKAGSQAGALPVLDASARKRIYMRAQVLAPDHDYNAELSVIAALTVELGQPSWASAHVIALALPHERLDAVLPEYAMFYGGGVAASDGDETLLALSLMMWMAEDAEYPVQLAPVRSYPVASV